MINLPTCVSPDTYLIFLQKYQLVSFFLDCLDYIFYFIYLLLTIVSRNESIYINSYCKNDSPWYKRQAENFQPCREVDFPKKRKQAKHLYRMSNKEKMQNLQWITWKTIAGSSWGIPPIISTNWKTNMFGLMAVKRRRVKFTNIGARYYVARDTKVIIKPITLESAQSIVRRVWLWESRIYTVVGHPHLVR